MRLYSFSSTVNKCCPSVAMCLDSIQAGAELDQARVKLEVIAEVGVAIVIKAVVLFRWMVGSNKINAKLNLS